MFQGFCWLALYELMTIRRVNHSKAFQHLFFDINVSSWVGPLQKKVGVLHDNNTDFFSAASLTWCVTGATSLKHHSPSTWPVFWLEHWSWAPWLTGMDHYPYVMTLIKCKSTLNSFSGDLLTHVKINLQ